MEWEVLDNLNTDTIPPLSDIVLDARVLEEKLQEIVYNLTPSPTRTQLRQTERDREILEQFHLLGTTGHNDFGSEIKWSTPLNAVTLVDKAEECMHLLETLVGRVVNEELQVYRRQAQLSPPPPTKSLDVIQTLCEMTLDLMQGLQRIFNRLQDNIHQNHNVQIPVNTLVRLRALLTSLFERILGETLVVETQPPQVVKVNTKFPNPIRLRWLVGAKVMSVWNGRLVEGSPVSADVVNEPQAQALIKSTPKAVLNSGNFRPCGILSSDRSEQISKPEFVSSEDGQLALCVVHFRHMQLKKIDREYKKVKGGHQPSATSQGSGGRNRVASGPNPPALVNTAWFPTVTDEKFCIFFHMQIDVGENRLLIFTFSHPLVATTHGVQEAHAWATIIWDNYFTLNKLPFDVPDRVPWSKLAEMLNSKFKNATGVGLDGRQLAVLRVKLAPDLSDKSDSETMITFARFAKENMSTAPLVFWEWFYSCLKVTERHFARHWRDGLVYGFIGRLEAEQMLRGWKPGTFLLRFSDSMLGGISICYVSANGTPFSVMPFTTKNLTFRSLSDSLYDLDNLTILYPTTPKDSAFPPNLTVNPAINYSILKGVLAQQQSHQCPSPPKSNKSSPTKSYGSSSVVSSPISSRPSTTSSTSSPTTPASISIMSPTRAFTLAETSTKPKPTSDYVESYPKISLPRSHI
ncbi:signal transducer and activator of transcription 5B isoform X3 [Folsomia candida]|uniref:signal transducer and activator of transcription 5B isoform X3 n=1 Tax=Folsomia candida TaxID=158441 RepID=UPI000B90422A|nr:signal transducer and activator of transcription 5B isoform X3 [Folsomia candida]